MITLDKNRVAELFALFADLEGEDLTPWQGLCEAASSALAARLRPEVGAEAMEALSIAAAGIAYSDYLALRRSSSRESLKVGDISLSAGSDAGIAGINSTELREHFLAGVARLLLPECPALIATGGDA